MRSLRLDELFAPWHHRIHWISLCERKAVERRASLLVAYRELIPPRLTWKEHPQAGIKSLFDRSRVDVCMD
jgi:hypothetical protein